MVDMPLIHNHFREKNKSINLKVVHLLVSFSTGTVTILVVYLMFIVDCKGNPTVPPLALISGNKDVIHEKYEFSCGCRSI